MVEKRVTEPSSEDCLQQPKLTMNDETVRLSWILGAGWVSFAIGACFADRFSVMSITSHFEPSVTLLIFVLISLLLCLLRSRLNLAGQALMIPPIVCALMIAGASIESNHLISLSQRSAPPLESDQGQLSLSELQETQWSASGVVIDQHSFEGQVRTTFDLTALSKRSDIDQKIERIKLSHPLRVINTHKELLESSHSLKVGDRIHFSGHLTWVAGRTSPHLRKYQEYLARRGISWRARGHLFKRSHFYNGSWISQYRALINDSLNDFSSRSSTASGAQLISAFVLGDRSKLSSDLLKAVREMGLGHLFAVSGLHIGTCALLFMLIGLKLSARLGALYPVFWGWGMMICGAWIYLILSGSSLSAQRATFMISLFAGSRLFLSPLSALTSLWLTAWILIVQTPSIAEEMGLQLSLMATLGLILSAYPLSILRADRVERQRFMSTQDRFTLKSSLKSTFSSFTDYLWTSASIAGVAWLCTAPIFAWHLGELNLASPLYNALLTPILSASFIPLSLFSSLLVPITDLPLEYTAILGGVIADGIIWVCPSSSLTFAVGRAWTLPLLAVLTLSFLTLERWRLSDRVVAIALLLKSRSLRDPSTEILSFSERAKRRMLISKVSILLISLLVIGCIERMYFEEPASATFMYVGQGDATLLCNGEGGYALFDVGPKGAARSLVRRLRLLGVNRLDWVAISHLHPDHYGGLLEIIDHFEVEKVIYHGREPRHKDSKSLISHKYQTLRVMTWHEVSERLSRSKVSVRSQAQEEVRWGRLNLKWLFSTPSRELSENDASLALLISSDSEPRYSALLSGDLEAEGEERLRAEWKNQGLKNQALYIWQINHHGSSTSTEQETLQLLQPKVAVLSLDGAHRFGFPHPRTVHSLKEENLKSIRLDLDGDYNYIFESRISNGIDALIFLVSHIGGLIYENK